LQTACTSRPRRSRAWPAESSTTGSVPPVAARLSNEVAPSIRTLRRSPCAELPTSRSATAAARRVVTDSAREPSEANPARALPTALTGEEPASAAHDGGVPGLATTFGSGDAAPPGPTIGAVLADVGGEAGSAGSYLRLACCRGLVRRCRRLRSSRASQQEGHEHQAWQCDRP
jgi:hypothetical protein